MAGLFALSVDPDVYSGDFSDDVFKGTMFQTISGEKRFGVSARDGLEIKSYYGEGTVRDGFERSVGKISGDMAISYCGSFKEPLETHSRFGRICLSYSGVIANRDELLRRLQIRHVLNKLENIDIIAILLVTMGNPDMADCINALFSSELKGSFSLVVLTGEGIYAAVSLNSQLPLFLGRKEGAVAIASGITGFSGMGFHYEREVGRGEIILLSRGSDKLILKGISGPTCLRALVYSLFPDNKIMEKQVSEMRKLWGALSAEADINSGFIPDYVCGVPNSGLLPAVGYQQRFCQKAAELRRVPLYGLLIFKFPHCIRSEDLDTQDERGSEDHLKFIPCGERFDGKTVVLCRPSIYTGNQTRYLVGMLRQMGFKEVHLRISIPPILSRCSWGSRAREACDALASEFSETGEMARSLGADSLAYNSIEDIAETIGVFSEQICGCCCLK